MPARQPFTSLCQALAKPRTWGRVDLHSHTTFSDGAYTPAQLVDLARRSGLPALAVTDHDTLDGIGPAINAAGTNLEIVTGVEISTEWRGNELHLLGYFIDVDHPSLRAALENLQAHRVQRFYAMAERLNDLGVHLQRGDLDSQPPGTTLGRRHLAALLVKAGKASSIREAFQRWLSDRGRAYVAKVRIPVADAIALVRQAGGVAAWAHPSYDATRDDLLELHGMGLQAVEVEFPRCRANRGRVLRRWAKELDLAVTGGSDCHGPDEPANAVGACGITWDELQLLRERSRAVSCEVAR